MSGGGGVAAGRECARRAGDRLAWAGNGGDAGRFPGRLSAWRGGLQMRDGLAEVSSGGPDATQRLRGRRSLDGLVGGGRLAVRKVLFSASEVHERNGSLELPGWPCC